MEVELVQDLNLKYDKIYFLADCPHFFRHLKEYLEHLNIYSEEKLIQHPIDVPKAKQLVGSVEDYCQRQVHEAVTNTLKDEITPLTLVITSKRGVTQKNGKHHDNIGTLITQGHNVENKLPLKFFTWGCGAEIPSIIIQKGEELTGEEYEFKSQGFSVKISKLIEQEFGQEKIPNSWNWSLNDTFNNNDADQWGVDSIKLAFGKVWLTWQIETYHDFPTPGLVFEDVLQLMCQGTTYAEMVELYALEVKTSVGLENFEVIAAIGARGFIWGAALSSVLKKGLILIRKKGKLPGIKHEQTYNVWSKDEVMEVNKGLLKEGAKVILIDDYIESGGTSKAAIDVLFKAKSEIVGVGTLKMRPEKWESAKTTMGHHNCFYLF